MQGGTLLDQDMPTRGKKPKGAAAAGAGRYPPTGGGRQRTTNLDMAALGEALQDERLHELTEAGAACGLGSQAAQRMQEVQAFTRKVAERETHRKEEEEREIATEVALSNIREINERALACGITLDEARMTQAVTLLRRKSMGSGLQMAVLRQTVFTAYIRALTEYPEAPGAYARTRQISLLGANPGGAREAIRIRINSPSNIEGDRVAQARLQAEHWARELGIQPPAFLPHDPSNRGHYLVGTIYNPPTMLIQQLWEGSHLEFGQGEAKIRLEAKLMLSPQEFEFDVKPLAGEESQLEDIAETLGALKLSVGQLEHFLLRCLQQSCENELAQALLYVRVELGRRSGNDIRRLDPFSLGSKGGGGGPRITVAVRDAARVPPPTSAHGQFLLGPSDSQHIGRVNVLFSRGQRGTLSWPTSQNEACRSLRADAVAFFENAQRKLSDFLAAARQLLAAEAEEGSTLSFANNMQDLLLSFRSETGLMEEIHAPAALILEANPGLDSAQLQAIHKSLKVVVTAVETFIKGPWAQKKGQMGMVWCKPRDVNAFRDKVKTRVQGRRPTAESWRAALEALLRQEPDIGEGIRLQVYKVGIKVTPQNRFDLGSFPVMVMNGPVILSKLSRSRTSTLAGLAAEVKWMEEVTERGTPLLELMRERLEAGVFFFAPINASDEAPNQLGQRRATALKDMGGPEGLGPLHVRNLADTLQKPPEEVDYVMEVLGNLRRQGLAETVPLPRPKLVAYGLKAFIKTLNDHASSSDWAAELQPETEDQEWLWKGLKFVLRAAIYHAAAQGCWQENQEIGSAGFSVQDAMTLEFNYTGLGTMARVVAPFASLASYLDLNEFVIEALQLLLHDKEIQAWGIGGHTLFLRSEFRIVLEEGGENLPAMTPGDLPPAERINFSEPKQADVCEQLLSFLRAGNILVVAPPETPQEHWAAVAKCPQYFTTLVAPTLANKLSQKTEGETARLLPNDLIEASTTDSLTSASFRHACFVPASGSSQGWIQAPEYSLKHALLQDAAGLGEQLAWRSVKQLVEEGRVLSLEDGGRTAFYSPRMLSSLQITKKTMQNSFTGIHLTMGKRTLARKSSTSWHKDLAAFFREDEEAGLKEHLLAMPLPLFLPFQPDDPGESISMATVQQVFQILEHPLVTTAEGFSIMRETLRGRGVFRRTSQGLLLLDHEDGLVNVEQADLDKTNIADPKAMETLRRSILKRGREMEDAGHDGEARAAAKPAHSLE